MAKEVTLILAHGRDGVIGNHGDLPWPAHAEDMRRFRQATMGSTVIMGRKTYDSIGKPLPWRQNVVVSHRPETVAGDVTAVRDIHQAVAAAGDTGAFVIGGAMIYGVAMPYATRILLTVMEGEFAGDVYFKVPFLHQWKETAREEWTAREGSAGCTFHEYRLE